MPAITVSDAAVLHHPAEALILTMTSATALNPELAAVNDALDGGIAQQVTDGHFRPAPENVMVLPTFGRVAAMHVVVVGLGDESRLSAMGYERAMVAAIRKAYDWGGDDMATVIPRIGGTRYFAEVVNALVAACNDAKKYVRRMDVVLRTGQDLVTVSRMVAEAQGQ